MPGSQCADDQSCLAIVHDKHLFQVIHDAIRDAYHTLLRRCRIIMQTFIVAVAMTHRAIGRNSTWLRPHFI